MTAATFTAAAYRNTHTGAVSHARIDGGFPTVEAAREFVATLPKFIKAKTAGVHHGDGRPNSGCVWLHVNIEADGVNGGVNEIGMKRLRKFLSLVSYTVVTNAGNAVSPDEFAALVK